MNLLDTKLRVIWGIGRASRKARQGLGAYARTCARYGTAVLLTAGVVGIVVAFVHASPARCELFAVEMFTGAAIVQVIQWWPSRHDCEEHDCSCSHEEESA